MPNTRGKRKEILPVDEVMDTNKTVADETTNATSNITFSSKKGIVKCSKLNVRKEPTKCSDILKIISEGTEVEILKDAGDSWYKVRVGEIKNGYCMKEFIKVDK